MMDGMMAEVTAKRRWEVNNNEGECGNIVGSEKNKKGFHTHLMRRL